jgi:hypothetical protein
MQRRGYKGSVIEAGSYELRDNLGWDSFFTIEEHDGSGVTATEFFLKSIYKTYEEAIAAAFVHAQRKLDSGFSAR